MRDKRFADDLREQIALELGKPSADIVVREEDLNRPIRLAEFLVRLEAMAKKSDNIVEFGNCKLDAARRVFAAAGGSGEIKLTEMEAGILKKLAAAGGVVSREELLESVWEYSPEATTHTVETHIYRLRQKIERPGGTPVILTVEGGYRLGK